MSYRVVLTSKAELQLSNAALWWAENRNSVEAIRWLDGFQAALAALAENPESHPVAHEDQLDDLPFTVRQILYGLSRNRTHRALFETRGDVVYVVAIRHLAQRDITAEDI